MGITKSMKMRRPQSPWRSIPLFSILSGVALAQTLPGCDGGAPREPKSEQVAVSGSVMIAGQPIPAGSSIFFFCEATGITAWGILDEEGTFTLAAVDPFISLPAGKYQVMVRPPVSKGRENDTAIDASCPIPQKFQSFASSQIVLDVEVGVNDFDIELDTESP